MNYRDWYYSTSGHNSRNYQDNLYFDHEGQRDRAWRGPQSWSRDQQEGMTAQGISSSSLAGNLDEQNMNSVQSRPRPGHPGSQAIPYHPYQRGNSNPQSSFTHYNQHENHFPRYQRNEPLTTILGNRSNFINQANLLSVRPQENPSTSKAQENSQTSNPQRDPRLKQQNVTKVSMTTPPFLEVVAPLLEVQLTPGKFTI